MEDAAQWTMEQDDGGDIIFLHRETQVRNTRVGTHVRSFQVYRPKIGLGSVSRKSKAIVHAVHL